MSAEGARSLLVLGGGRSGCAAAKLAEALGYSTAVVGDDRTESLPDGEFDFAVTSPGIALSHPWQIACRERGLRVESELEFGCDALKRRGVRLLAVTGSKGKSSVVKVVADGLNAAGLRAIACGNYGLPVSEVATMAAPPDFAVVEVSSFMMETTALASDAFAAAAILNLQEDHLDRHGTVEVYHALKRKLLSFAERGYDLSESWRSAWPEKTTDPAGLIAANSYFDNEILFSNGVAAALLMRAAGLSDDEIRTAFADFVPLAHRFQTVAEMDGVIYVDDSKATSLAALAAGVAMASKRGGVRLVAGGLAKGDDPNSVLSILTKWVKKVYLIGKCAEQFHSSWKSSVDCEICGTLDRAVEAARHEAAKGEVVLLSPGTASFDQFKSFEERGEVFARLARKEGNGK